MKQFRIGERLTPSGAKSIQKYFNDLEKCHPIDPDEEYNLIKKAQQGDMVAKEKVIKANLRFVISVAKMYSFDGEVFSDLISAGNIGLIESLDKFDMDRGFKFISYAVWHIRKEMIKYLSENSRSIRIPSGKSQEIKVIEDIAIKIESETGIEPSLDDVLLRLKESGDPRFQKTDLHTISKLIEANNKPISLDAPRKTDQDSITFGDSIGEVDENIENEMESDFLRSIINDMLHVLGPNASEIVMRHHGIMEGTNGEEQSFNQIAIEMEWPYERVRTNYKRALVTLRRYLRKRGMKLEDLIVK